MNLLEFADFQAAKRWKRFVYLTENQPDFETGLHPLKMALTFDKMTVSAVVDVGGLFFRRGENYATISAIRRIDCKPCVLGDILEIVCKNGEKYIFVAQE